MTVTVCFDALGTCFSLDPVVQALDEVMGDQLRSAGSCPKMTIMDWVSSFHRRSHSNSRSMRSVGWLGIQGGRPERMARGLAGSLTLASSMLHNETIHIDQSPPHPHLPCPKSLRSHSLGHLPSLWVVNPPSPPPPPLPHYQISHQSLLNSPP